MGKMYILSCGADGILRTLVMPPGKVASFNSRARNQFSGSVPIHSLIYTLRDCQIVPNIYIARNR